MKYLSYSPKKSVAAIQKCFSKQRQTALMAYYNPVPHGHELPLPKNRDTNDRFYHLPQIHELYIFHYCKIESHGFGYFPIFIGRWLRSAASHFPWAST